MATMPRAVLLLVLLGYASPVLASNVAAVDQKNRPVSKVITLLKDMISQLEKEAEEDEEIYEQMGCWCETGAKEKTKAIADAESLISQLGSGIEEMSAKSATLSAEMGNLESEVAQNTEALEKATEVRKKELAEFNVEEKANLQTIESLKAAVITLSKHHDASFLQTDSTAEQVDFAKFVASLHRILRENGDELKGMITPSQRRTLADFVQTPEDNFEVPSYSYSLTQSSAPASGEIFGILKAMKESFETNLANSQKEEAQSQADYESLKKAKEEEIKAGQTQIDTKSEELAATDEKNAQAKVDLEDTRAALAADTEFLSVLKQSCQNVDQEYEERTKTRQLEIEACSKALAFLSSDEAHELFTRTFNPALVQTRSSSRVKRRAQVSKVLNAAAQKSQDPRLSAIAVRARIDAFTKVKKSIQDMVDKLTQEKKDEIKHKDFCIEELNNNERDTENKQRDKSDLEAKIADLAMSIDTLSKDIVNLKAEIEELKVQMKRASEDREKENKEMQTVVADQRATQKLITASLSILKGFYEKAALVQKHEQTQKQQGGQAPPPGFKKYEKNSSSGGVMGMMENIIEESKQLEAEAIRSEEDAQADYEEFVKDTNATIDAHTKDITNKSEAKAKDESDKVQAETEAEAALGELEQLANENADLHKSCDFTLKNFEIRQGARDDEIDALKQALAIFSGASFGAFLQREQ